MMRRVSRGARSERGATAIVVALVAFVLFGAAALGVDIANLTMERQELHDAVDAAAQAAAFDLPLATAATTATTFAKFNDPDANPTSKLYCVIAANSSNLPTSAQVPATCDPDGSGVYVGGGWSCARGICAKPCGTSPNVKCNTVRVEAKKDVPFFFAPVIGYDKGNTGAVVSAACKGSCGNETPNPLDIVVVADRTPSMGGALPSLRSSIRSMMTTMDPSMHFLALGTIDAAAAKPSTASLLGSTNCPTGSTANHVAREDPGGGPTVADMKEGWWMATQFSNTYTTKSGTSFVLNDRDRVSNAVKCLDFSTGPTGSYYRTHLAAPLRSAVQHLWDESATNLRTLSTGADRPGNVRKVVIFETDGAPLESRGQAGNLNVSTVDSEMGTFEPRSTSAGTACQNLRNVADAAKEKGTIIITVGFGDAATGTCGVNRISDVLAAVATDSDSGGCDTATKRSDENADGDYFFCAVTGTELASIFTTAFSQLSKGIKLVNLP